MNIQIRILKVTVTTKTGKNGKPYQNAEVAYVDLGQNKTTSKNITKFSKVFDTLAEAKPDQVFDIVSEKNGDYWEWNSATRVLEGAAGSAEPSPSRPQAAPRSNYETPEERAKRQVYIVRQTGLERAIETLSIGAKTPPKAEAVIALADVYVNYVFSGDDTSEDEDDVFNLPNDLEVE